MKHGFRRCQLGNGRHYAERVRGQHDEILRVPGASRLRSVGNEVHRVSSARILGLRAIVEIADARYRIKGDVFQDRSEALGGRIYGRLGFSTQLDRLRIAAALEIEDAFGTPTVLVITD